jgi:hypothetical protein
MSWMWGRQSCLPPPFRRRLEFLPLLTAPRRFLVGQAVSPVTAAFQAALAAQELRRQLLESLPQPPQNLRRVIQSIQRQPQHARWCELRAAGLSYQSHELLRIHFGLPMELDAGNSLAQRLF